MIQIPGLLKLRIQISSPRLHDVWMRGTQICVPEHLNIKQKIMYEMHAAPYSGHLGTQNTERNIAQHYWWPNMQKEVIQYVKYVPFAKEIGSQLINLMGKC